MHALTWLALIAGCGGEDHRGGMSMSGYATAYDVHVDELRDETEAHGARIAAMEDRSEMDEEEAAHGMDVAGHLAGMEHEMEHMGMCDDDDGMTPDMSSMQRMQDDCAGELDDHGRAMADAPDVDAAHAEETRHQSAMADWFDAMGMMSGDMMDMGGMYTCPHHD